MEKKMEIEMETGEYLGSRNLNLSYSLGQTKLVAMYSHYGNLI